MSYEHYLPLSKPKEGVAGETGSWRFQRPVIDTSKCVGCGMCWLYCPESAIELVRTNGKEVASIDYRYCKGCCICSRICPVKAIKVVPEG